MQIGEYNADNNDYRIYYKIKTHFECGHSHTQNEFLSCGGDTITSPLNDLHRNDCEVYNPLTASWSLESYNLTDYIWGHNSWSLGNGSVLLLGGTGYYLDGTTEWHEKNDKTEMVTQGVGSTKSFDLHHPCE